jgi:3',5'-cyclic AMP phosphodiesterase CpdA
MCIRLAIISDLHVGNARGVDLNPSNTNLEQPFVKSYLDEFENFVEDKGIKSDYLVIPGDVSHGANPKQVSVASDAIARCASLLNVTTDKLIFVPGNHDVDWSVFDGEDPTGHYKQFRYSSINDDSYIFSTINSNGHADLFEEPFFNAWVFDDIAFIGYNSSWHDGPEHSIHCGKVNPQHINRIERFTKENVPDDLYKVFMLHHHPLVHSDINQDDYSTLQNADSLRNTLYRLSIDLLVHGHKHRPQVKPIFEGQGHPIVVICAGSFSAQVNSFPDPPTNQFHLIDIDCRDTKTGNALGRVGSWSYTFKDGWVRSRGIHKTGISHQENFGFFPSLTEAVNLLRPLIQQKLDNDGYVTWEEIVDMEEKVNRIPNEQRRLSLEQLSNDLCYELMMTEGDIVLLQK